jgi:C-terminal processing protease CtpA/Prc
LREYNLRAAGGGADCDQFGMGITETRAFHPFSTHDWDGTGVEPDVKVKAADALERAEQLAERKLRKK